MKVLLDIKSELLRSYLRHIFEPLKETPGGASVSFKATRKNTFGTLLCALVRYSNQRSPHIITPSTVCFQLPNCSSLHNAPNYHLYYTVEDANKLNDLLESLFNIAFDQYYLQGIHKGYQKKDIITSFIVTRQLTGLEDISGSLKKRQYRQEAKALAERTSQLINRAYDRHDRITHFDPSKVIQTRQKII